MKKIILCSLLAIAGMHAMDESGNTAVNSDDTPKKKLNNFNEAMNDTIQEIDTTTKKVSKLLVRAVALEQVIRYGITDFKRFTILSQLNFKMDETSKKIQSDTLRAELEKENITPQEKASLLEATLHLLEISHEEMVLSQVVEEMESIVKAAFKTQTKKRADESSNWCNVL